MGDKYFQEYGPIRRRRSGAPAYEPPPERGEPAPVREKPRRSRRRRGSLVGSLLFLLLAVAIALALPYATNLLASDQALQGVRVHGQAVGGMDRESIRRMLELRYAAFLDTPVTLTFEDRTWEPSLADLGASFDIDAMADAALAAGRQGGPFERTRALWALWRSGGLDVAPRLSLDAARLQAYLTNLASEIDQPPRSAALSIAEGKPIPTAAQPGRQLLVDATASDIVRSLWSLEPGNVVLRTRLLEPAIDDVELAAARDDAQALLRGSLTLRHNDRSWTWAPEQIGELLTVSVDDSSMQVSLDPERLAWAVERLAQLVDSPSVEPRLTFRDGQVTIVEPGRAGWELDQVAGAELISDTLRTQRRALALPVTRVEPQVTAETLPDLGIVELVGEGKTSFAGSAEYRITNIKAGAARMDGVLIAPDEEFSFNTQLGAVDASNGFVEGYAVIGNRTQLEWGGGVCQDSTTVFRAAFWAGLPITERHAHPFYISWYDAFSFPDQAGPGMDATIFTGVQDLKFLNDTGHWLLMTAEVDEVNQVLTVRLYGTKPNRTVSIIGPQIDNVVPPPAAPVYVDDPALPAGTVRQTDVARNGMDIAVYRVITENGVQKEPELFFTRFKAWPNVFVRGTGQ